MGLATGILHHSLGGSLTAGVRPIEMPDTASLREIAEQLRWVVTTSPAAADDVERWTIEAGQTWDEVTRKHPSISFPMEISHYLNDADIRARDPEYRAHQTAAMEQIIASLMSGAVPASGVFALSILPGLTLSLPRACVPWLIGIVALVLGLLAWMILR